MATNFTMNGPPSLPQAAVSVLSLVLNPPLPGFLRYIPFLCRLFAIILATPFALFTILDVIAYAIARTLHISLRSLRVPHSPPTQSTPLVARSSVVPLTPSASALSLIQDSGSETEDAEGEDMPKPSAERRRSEKGLQMTSVSGSGLRMRKPPRQEPTRGLALEFEPSPEPVASTISNISALSQFSVDSSAASTPSLDSPPVLKDLPILGAPIPVVQSQTAYPSPPLSPARTRRELVPVS